MLNPTPNPSAASRACSHGDARFLKQVQKPAVGGGSVMAALVFLPTVAFAQVPDQFLGKWSTDPNRCEQVNGEVDVLEVTKSGFAFYEIGCELKQPARASNAVRFAARCYKGGSPDSSGTVVMRRLAPDKIDVSLRGFFWTSEKPEAFRRCLADR
jgi:hypothetical protein